MRKLVYLIVVLAALGLIIAGCFSVVPPTEQGVAGDKAKCATIQGGTIFDTKGNAITMGYDKWGYNYQAHIFNGWYWNYSRPDVPRTKETLEEAGKSNTWLVMKWNDVWLSNKDCNGDGILDRGCAGRTNICKTDSGNYGKINIRFSIISSYLNPVKIRNKSYS